PLAVSVSHPETGEIVAGLLAGTNYGQLHVLVLFVQEELRGAGQLSSTPLPQANAYAMVRRRAAAAGIGTKIGNHTFRATGITA
ncbi:hypothetical protein AB4Y44_42775, partial [Paraburkholderia sp. BR10937]